MNTPMLAVIRCSLLVLVSAAAYAGSAQWNLNPTSNDWNTAANWTPMTVPNGPADTATFGFSNITTVSISADTEVNVITFAPDNPGYTIDVFDPVLMTISGIGVIGAGRFEVNGGFIAFSNSSTAGDSNFVLVGLGNSLPMLFTDNSNAGNATIDQIGGGLLFLGNSTADNMRLRQIFFSGGCFVEFRDNSTAGQGLIEGGDETCSVTFSNTASAGSALVESIGAFIGFGDSSTAASASIEVFGGTVELGNSSLGGTAQIELQSDVIGFTPGNLRISRHNFPGVTIGSIASSGAADGAFVYLGANNLTVGSNDLSTTFSGVIEDNGLSGSLTKIGTGTLDLKGVNTYTGQTNINGGVLQVDGSISSNTFINHKGALVGGGTVYGNVTNYSGEVSPGDPLGVPGVLTVSGNYMQTPSATLTVQIGGTDPDQVSVLNVLGNANLKGALDPELVNGFVPAIGQSFSILGYASVTGLFSHIRNKVFDNGRKRWSLVYQPTGAALVVESNGRVKASAALKAKDHSTLRKI
jgi:autotransporter-associated beta strand protein